MVSTLAKTYNGAVTLESQTFQRFCSGCDYADDRNVCPAKNRIEAFGYDRCDWSMIKGVGAMPRTATTLTIYDPSNGEYVEVDRSNEAAVREAISRNLRARLSN